MNRYRCAVLSVVKHDYISRAVASHPRFELVVVADDPGRPDWTHIRNQLFADEFKIPYILDVEKAIHDYQCQVAIISSEAERHADLTVRATQLRVHIIQDKPMSTRLSQCDRIVEAVEQHHVRFLLWNRNYLPSVLHARELIASGIIGELRAVHIDFYFAKDAGPPKGTPTAEGTPLNWLTHQLAAHADGSDGSLGSTPMGELLCEGIYPLGYLRMLTEARIQRVFARTTAHFHQLYVDNQVEDLASVTLEMERGILGSICLGRIGAASHPDLGEIKLHLIGDKGAVVINESRPEIAVYYRGQPEKEFRHRRVSVDHDYLLVEEFLHALEFQQETILNARTSRLCSAVVHAALQSAQTGQLVEVT